MNRFIKLEKYATRSLLAFVTIVVLIILLPLQIISGWKLTTDRNTYHIGDKIYLTSEYTKRYNVKGQSSRALECKTPTGWASYPIFYAFAGSDSGYQKTVSKVTIPQIDQKLPVQCHIRIDVLYALIGIKPIAQHATSNDFWVDPREGEQQ
jgi:hypothetical protein